MRRHRHLSLFAAVLCCAGSLAARAQIASVGDGGPGPVKAQHLTAELTSLAPSVAPGQSLEVGLVLTLEEKWHVYWINAGDSGEPPRITWTLPKGITASPMRFPIPTRLPLGPLMDFGYEDTVAFPVKLSIDPGLKPGPAHLDAKVDWLVCREVCIPGKAHLGLDITVDPNASPASQPVGALGEALSLLPTELEPRMHLTVNGGAHDFVFTLITGDKETDAEFYPFDQDQIINAADQISEPIPGGIRLRVKRDPQLKELPKEIHGLIRLSDSQAYEVTAAVIPGEVAGASISGLQAPPPSELTTFTAIGLAFAGGIILNLMPCVFPVLFLKALALVQSSSEERSRLRMHGLIYTLGILVSFWFIVALLLGLRSTTHQIGWGFQLQSPAFLAVLAVGLFFFALSLAGQFDLGLTFTNAGDSLTQKQGLTGTFFTGVLADCRSDPVYRPIDGRGGRIRTRTAGVDHLRDLHGTGTWSGAPILIAECTALLDAFAAEARALDGVAEAAYGCRIFRHGDLADLDLWTPFLDRIPGRGDRSRRKAAYGLSGDFDRGLDSRALAGSHAFYHCGGSAGFDRRGNPSIRAEEYKACVARIYEGVA